MNSKRKGLGIGMVVCAVIGIALSEFGGYHNVLPFSTIFGAALGLFIGNILERRDKKIC